MIHCVQVGECVFNVCNGDCFGETEPVSNFFDRTLTADEDAFIVVLLVQMKGAVGQHDLIDLDLLEINIKISLRPFVKTILCGFSNKPRLMHRSM